MKYNQRDAKLYSRARICLPKIKKFNIGSKSNKINITFFKIITIIVISAITATFIVKSINPIVDKLCINEAQNIATKISNEQSTEVMKEYSYDDLVTVVRDSDNNISMIEANTKNINSIISEIPIKIVDELNNNSNSNISIYFGSILGIKVLSATGPKINAKIANTSNIETTLKSDFTDAGINQTLHSIYLEITVQVSILTPFNVIDNEKIVNQVLLAESVIVGKVPQSYYNLNNTSASDSLKVVK